jgi:hypothetical protein
VCQGGYYGNGYFLNFGNGNWDIFDFIETYLHGGNVHTRIYFDGRQIGGSATDYIGFSTLLGVLIMPMNYAGHFQDIFSDRPPTICDGGICRNTWGVAGFQIGQSFGKLGTVVENPGIELKGFTPYGLNRFIERGMTEEMITETLANPTLVLEQSAGQYLYLSSQAGVAISPEGQVITTYPASMFDPNIQEILGSSGEGVGEGIDFIPE